MHWKPKVACGLLVLFRELSLVVAGGFCNLRGHDIPEPYPIDELGRRLGAGSYGHVYVAHTEEGLPAAAKFLDAESVEKDGDVEDAMDDFFLELKIHSRMRHPRIVKCLGLGVVPADLVPEDAYIIELDQLNPPSPWTWTRGVCPTGGEDWGVEEGPPTLVFLMELLDRAVTLRKFLWDGHIKTCPPPGWRLSCALDLARAMAYVHALGVIHFDIKSDNALVTADGRCILADFGLSVISRGVPIKGFSRRGSILYMAPEVIRRGTMKTSKVDVYSFSIMMWEMLACQEPYKRLKYRQIKQLVPNQRLRPYVHPSWREGDAGAFIRLIERCWMTDPAKRPDFVQLADELERMLNPLAVKVPKHPRS